MAFKATQRKRVKAKKKRERILKRLITKLDVAGKCLCLLRNCWNGVITSVFKPVSN